MQSIPTSHRNPQTKYKWFSHSLFFWSISKIRYGYFLTNQKKRLLDTHTHTIWSKLRWDVEEKLQTTAFRIWPGKGPTQGKTFVFFGKCGWELHWAPSPHCLQRIFRDFFGDSCFQKEALQFYPGGAVKNPLPGIRLNKQQDSWVHFCQPHALRCVLIRCFDSVWKDSTKGGPLADRYLHGILSSL